ncbi:MAG: hypothetical protein ACTHMS_16305 [Jatrophihabitans sp.]|uniref:hypothetical protein n=1 Tax=Jatrophihabitans sp. TaxID=1932789 RepID=UPI003F7F4C93
MDWPVTTRLLYSLLNPRGRLKRGRLVDAAVRAALLIDLASARLIIERDGVIKGGAAGSGFAPATLMLAEIAALPSATVETLVCRGSVSRADVAQALVARHSWAAMTGSVLRPGVRYEVLLQLPEPCRDNPSDVLVDLMLRMFDADFDRDEFAEQVDRSGGSTAAWLIPSVMHELLELRDWLAVANVGNDGSGGG